MALAARNPVGCASSGSTSGSRAVVAPAMLSRRAAAPRRAAVRVRSEESAKEAAATPLEKTGPNFTPLRDINQIMATLPHRWGACLHTRRGLLGWQPRRAALVAPCTSRPCAPRSAGVKTPAAGRKAAI
eukprot:361174-Chlamydomonas_euryale.AAC.6